MAPTQQCIDKSLPYLTGQIQVKVFPVDILPEDMYKHLSFISSPYNQLQGKHLKVWKQHFNEIDIEYPYISTTTTTTG